MRTSLVVKQYGDTGYKRARRIEDDNGDARVRGVPVYVAPHRAHGLRGNGQAEWDEPEAVHTPGARYRPSRGKVNEIRVMDDAFIAELEKIDTEREQINERLAQLRKDEQSLLDDAYLRGTPVTVAQVKEWTNANRARRQREPVTA